MTDNKLSYNPDTLSERLDDLLPAGSSDNRAIHDADPLVQTAAHLASMPVPKLSPEAAARIRAKLPPVQPVIRPVRWRGVMTSVTAAAAVLILIAVIAVRSLQPDDTRVAVGLSSTPENTVEPTALQTEQVLTEQPVTPTAVPTEQPATPTIEPPTQTPIPATDVPPTVTPDAGVNIVLQGEIEEVRENSVIVYGMEIYIESDDPLMEVLRKGDTVRIEGFVQGSGQNIVITPIDFEVLDEIVEVNPDGQVWRDEGGCNNPPPAWAAANGWRQRCTGTNNGNAGGNNGGGNGNGNGGSNRGSGRGNNRRS